MQGFLQEVTMLRDISNNMAFIAMYFKTVATCGLSDIKNRTRIEQSSFPM